MTILWSSVYAVLVVEASLLLALLLSCISTKAWYSAVALINSYIEALGEKLLQYSGTKSVIEALNANWIYEWRKRLFNAYTLFWTVVGFLGLLFLNCLRHLWTISIIRTEHKYQAVDEMAKMADNADMFRAQRNLYISGLAFGLALVIKRVFTLVITLGRVREERDKYKKFFMEQKDS